MVRQSIDTLQDMPDIMAETFNRLHQTAKDAAGDKSESHYQQLEKALTHIISINENFSGINGLYTGFNNLDKILGGIKKQTVNILAARPSVGKTTFAANIAENIAEKGYNVLFLSLEMNAGEILQKMIMHRAKIPFDVIEGHKATQEQLIKITQAAEELLNMPLRILDKSVDTIENIVLQSQVEHSKKPLDMLIIDHLHHISPSPGDRSYNKNDELGRYTKALKRLAKSLDVPILCLCQLNRGIEGRQDKYILSMSDLRESGNIEQDADTITLIGSNPAEKDPIEKNKRIFQVVKNRMGKCGNVTMYIKGEMSAFAELDKKPGNLIEPAATAGERQKATAEELALFKDKLKQASKKGKTKSQK